MEESSCIAVFDLDVCRREMIDTYLGMKNLKVGIFSHSSETICSNFAFIIITYLELLLLHSVTDLSLISRPQHVRIADGSFFFFKLRNKKSYQVYTVHGC